MSLELDPVELGFRRPFIQEVEEKLRLHNPNSEPVAFKVKTTAPKQYCVRPNSGRIEPGQQVEVSVLLQAMKEEPAPDAKCRDKFLVQSVAISAQDENLSVATVWSNIEQTARSSIQEKKIRVNFLPATGGATAAYAATPTRGVSEAPASYGSPMSSATSPQGVASTPYSERSTSKGAVIDGPAPQSNGYPPASTSESYVSQAAAPVAAAASTVAAAVPTSADELKAQLAAAQKQISTLTSQASEGLRQRKTEYVSKSSSSPATPSLGMQQAPGGVPVPVVAGLCLLSFLLAYILF